MDRSLHEEALVAAIAETPDQRDPYLVYGDWLQQHGEPRGQLIALLAAGSSAAASAVIRSNHATLLEQLAGRVDVEIDWYLGFIEAIRITAKVKAQQLAALTALFDAWSGRVVQAIAIDAPADVDAIVELIRARAPKTLARLTLGRAGQWVAPAELVAAFPRMTREPDAIWADAIAKAATQKLKLEIDVSKLPAMRDVELVLTGLRAELEKQRPIGMVAALKACIEPAELDQFVFALAKQWRKRESPKWAFDAIGPLGGDVCAGFLGHFFADWSHQRAVQALGHLAMIGSQVAIQEIVTAMCRITTRRPRRVEARQMLGQIAVQRGLDVTALIARNCPVKPLSRSEATTTQRWWLYDLMISGHRLSAADFATHVRDHELRGPLARTLVWADEQRLFDGTGEVQGRVGVVHPAELTAEQRDQWIETFARSGVEQTVLQLGRPTYALSDASFNALHDYAHDPVGFHALEARLTERDWYAAEQGDNGTTTAFGRDFERDQVTALAFVGDGRISSVVLQPLAGNVARRRFDTLHPVTRSELLYDLEAAVGRAAVQPTTQLKQPTVDRPGPAIVEKAKTGRSKCVVCSQPIAKDALRVGVVRMISTDAFKGRGTVWAHVECRAGVPELEGVTLDLG